MARVVRAALWSLAVGVAGHRARPESALLEEVAAEGLHPQRLALPLLAASVSGFAPAHVPQRAGTALGAGPREGEGPSKAPAEGLFGAPKEPQEGAGSAPEAPKTSQDLAERPKARAMAASGSQPEAADVKGLEARTVERVEPETSPLSDQDAPINARMATRNVRVPETAARVEKQGKPQASDQDAPTGARAAAFIVPGPDARRPVPSRRILQPDQGVAFGAAQSFAAYAEKQAAKAQAAKEKAAREQLKMPRGQGTAIDQGTQTDQGTLSPGAMSPDQDTPSPRTAWPVNQGPLAPAQPETPRSTRRPVDSNPPSPTEPRAMPARPLNQGLPMRPASAPRGRAVSARSLRPSQDSWGDRATQSFADYRARQAKGAPAEQGEPPVAKVPRGPGNSPAGSPTEEDGEDAARFPTGRRMSISAATPSFAEYRARREALSQAALPARWVEKLEPGSLRPVDGEEAYGATRIAYAKMAEPPHAEVMFTAFAGEGAAERYLHLSKVLRNTGFVPRVLGTVPTEDGVLVVSESVGERTLYSLIQESSHLRDSPSSLVVPIEQALPLIVDLLRSLAELERLDVVHGDLTSSSIYLVGADSHAMTANLAIACQPSGGKELSCARRKDPEFGDGVYYLRGSWAPEMADGFPTGVSNNVWHAGLLIEAMLLGVMLSPEDVPEEYGDVMDILSGMLREDPQARLTAEEALALALKAAGTRGIDVEPSPREALGEW